MSVRDRATGVELWVGTRKAVFLARGDEGRRRWSLTGPFLAGYEAYHVLPDPAMPGAAWATTNHRVWGNHIFRTEDAGATWEPLAGRPSFPEEQARQIRNLWHLALRGDDGERLLLGVDPAALFESEDGGRGWRWVRGLERHPTRRRWQPAKGGLALHSIQVDPRDPERLYVAVSAGGCYRSDDGGASWTPINRGVRADYLPERSPAAGHNPHALRLHPADPDRLYRQAHSGVYRSDDRGASWVEITGDLPSDFGYPVALDPGDPDRCWVVPEESSHMRCVCEGKLRVYETRDAGRSWRPRTEGLPQEAAWVSVLRDALCSDGLDPCGLYLGTSTGQLFASADGARWSLIAGFLPGVLCLGAAARGPRARAGGRSTS